MTAPPMFPWPWSAADGSVNWHAFNTLVSSLAFIIIEFPGISTSSLMKRIGPSISPVALHHLLGILEKGEIIEKTELSVPKENSKISLFDDDPIIGQQNDEDSEILSTIFWAKPDGLMKLASIFNPTSS